MAPVCKKRNKDSTYVCIRTYIVIVQTPLGPVDNEQTHRKEVASCFFFLRFFVFNGRSFLELLLNTGNETFTSRGIKFTIIIFDRTYTLRLQVV